MQRGSQEFDMIIRGIVMTRGEKGATIEEMRSDYFKMLGEQWPLYFRKIERVISYLNGISGLMMEKLDSGLCIWYIDDIGSNLSDRQMDSNNNINLASGRSDRSGDDPLMRRQVTTTTVSFVSGTVPSLSTSTTTSASSEAVTVSSLASSETFEPNERESDKLKRKLSHNDSCSHGGKRKKSNEIDPTKQMPLIEQNLNLHNWNSGTNGAMKQVTTSTEKENSILISNGAASGAIDAIECIEEIEVVSDSDYRAPIKNSEINQLQKAFPKGCQIGAKSNSVQTISATSTGTIGDEVVPPGYAIVGDDFMRSMISFEMFGGDFTHKPDKSFSYCFLGQTIRQAYHMVLDKQSEFKAQYPNIVVNVGAIDILLLRNLIDIQAEYARLVKAIVTIGCVPILTTIPDLQISNSNPNKKVIKQMVLLFNRFMEDLYLDGYHLIDLYTCLDSSDYHMQPKIIEVFDKNLEIRMWSATGRQKILDALNEIC